MIQNFKKMSSQFLGEGINHEGIPFKASFSTLSKKEVDGISFNFEAIGPDGAPLHLESSLLGKNFRGQTALWVLSSNHPGVFERVLKEEVQTPQGFKCIFAFGNKVDRNSFREEILIELSDKSLRYTYFWGLPGGDFAERSGCLMKAIN